jgi:hypothetical protein
MDKNPWLRDTLHGRKTISDLYTLPGKKRVVDIGLPVQTKHGVRVVNSAIGADSFTSKKSPADSAHQSASATP